MPNNTDSIQIYSCLFGSQLYGTNNENSDVDIKNVFVTHPKQLILGDSAYSIYNNQIIKGIDAENISLHKFLKLAAEGQTMAIDMLFADKYKTYLTSNIWKEHILPIRDKLITKNIRSFIGYALAQALKYSNKGNKINEYSGAMGFFEGIALFTDNNNIILRNIIPHIKNAFNYKLIKKSDTETNIRIEDIEIPTGATVGYAIDVLQKQIDKYGERANKAYINGGIDYKAVSHAYRTIKEVEELLNTGRIVFPLTYADEIKAIKYNEIDDIDEILAYITAQCDILKERIKYSDLPEKVDGNLINQTILNIYADLYNIKF